MRISERARHFDDVYQIIEQVLALAKFPSENTAPIFRVDSKGVVIYANDATHKVKGLVVGRGKDRVYKDLARVAEKVLRRKKRKIVELPSEGRVLALAVTPVPERRPDHAQASAEMGLRMVEAVERANRDLGTPFKARIGIHSGPVVAGIIGTHRFVYDVWGDTVNVASRLESHGLANRVQVSEATARLIEDSFELEPRGTISVKGKGKMKTFLLIAAESAPAETDSPAET